MANVQSRNLNWDEDTARNKLSAIEILKMFFYAEASARLIMDIGHPQFLNPIKFI